MQPFSHPEFYLHAGTWGCQGHRKLLPFHSCTDMLNVFFSPLMLIFSVGYLTYIQARSYFVTLVGTIVGQSHLEITLRNMSLLDNTLFSVDATRDETAASWSVTGVLLYLLFFFFFWGGGVLQMDTFHFIAGWVHLTNVLSMVLAHYLLVFFLNLVLRLVFVGVLAQYCFPSLSLIVLLISVPGL